MSANPCISQNSRKAKQNGPDARLSHRKRRETGIISYHHAVRRNLTAYFALGGVIVGLRPTSVNTSDLAHTWSGGPTVGATARAAHASSPCREGAPMNPPTNGLHVLSRRRFLHATAASVLTAAVAPARRTPARAAVAAPPTADPDFGALDAKIQAGMARYGIPGVAVGVLAQGREYVRGYGVTNVDCSRAGRRRHPLPHRLDHQDLHRHHRDAAGGAGHARPRGARAHLPARLPDLRPVGGGPGDPAPALEPQRRVAGRRLRGHGAGRRRPGPVRGGDGPAAAAHAARHGVRLQQRRRGAGRPRASRRPRA